jgi:hypothetical protein
MELDYLMLGREAVVSPMVLLEREPMTCSYYTQTISIFVQAMIHLNGSNTSPFLMIMRNSLDSSYFRWTIYIKP